MEGRQGKGLYVMRTLTFSFFLPLGMKKRSSYTLGIATVFLCYIVIRLFCFIKDTNSVIVICI